MFNDNDEMALDQFDIDLNFSIDNYIPEVLSPAGGGMGAVGFKSEGTNNQ